MTGSQGVKTNFTTPIRLDCSVLELPVVLHHEEHPNGWIGGHFLGCSSAYRTFSRAGLASTFRICWVVSALMIILPAC